MAGEKLTPRHKKALVKRWRSLYEKFPPDGLTKQELNEYNRALAAEKQRKEKTFVVLGGPIKSS